MTRAEAGRLGGLKTAERYGRKHMAEIGRRGGLYREPTLSELRQLAELKKKTKGGRLNNRICHSGEITDAAGRVIKRSRHLVVTAEGEAVGG